MLTLAIALLTSTPNAWAEGPGAPVNLRCEYMAAPLGIDTMAPRLSWEVNDSRRGAKQAAYQVLVAENSADLRRDCGTAWDTGKVDSDQSIHVEYGGARLRSRGRYCWKVRTWDRDGLASPWSAAPWEMGLLSEDDWRAEWVAMGEDELGPKLGQWIWHPEQAENQRVFLQKAFHVPGKIASASLRVASDNYAKVFANGREVGAHDTWETLATFDVAAALKGNAENLLAIEARNEDGPAGVLVGLQVVMEDGEEVDVVSDGSWLAATEMPLAWPVGKARSQGVVPAKVVANYGDQPWGRHSGAAGRSIYLRKEARLKRGIARARAYVTGLGLYELHINGRRVGQDVLTPGWTHYGKRVQYQTYDVTKLLRAGDNAVAAQLGRGWFSGRIAQRQPPAGGTNGSRLLLQLEVEYADGTTDTIVTDENWKAHLSPITADDFYDGESYDAQLGVPGWNEPGLDTSDWAPTRVLDEPIGKLVAQAGPTLRVTQTRPVEAVTQPQEGVYVFDFGQNASGRCRLTVRGAEEGQRIRIRHSEVLKDDGTLYTDNYRSAKVTDEYICKGEPVEIWEPSFTYRGFRYAELTGYPGEPPEDALVHRVLHSAPPWAGEFACSNETINSVQRNLRWGQISNMHSVPTDCPQRDERLGWTGDALIFTPTMCWNMETARFLGKWMADLIDSQGPNGETSDIAPLETGHGPASPGWGDVITTVPYYVHQFYGDTRIIEENYEGMKAWVEFMRSQAPDLLYEREGYGDWVAVVGSPKKPIGAAYFHYSTANLASMARALGKDDDARYYEDLADGIAAAFNAAYLDQATSSYPGGTQTANVLPLAFGIVPEDRREAVAKNIADDIVARDNHLSTGFLGTSYLMPTLAEHGYHELAYKLADQRTYPSWGYMVEKGATSIWELWNSDTQGPGMNSRNHYAFGSVGQWYFEDLAGIKPAAPGFKRITIRPRPAGDLTWAKATYPSMYGEAKSAWERDGDGLTLSVTVPANTSARVYVPLLGNDQPNVTESGTTVVMKGSRAERVAGLSYRGIEDGAAVFDAGAGTYEFMVK